MMADKLETKSAAVNHIQNPPHANLFHETDVGKDIVRGRQISLCPAMIDYYGIWRSYPDYKSRYPQTSETPFLQTSAKR